MNVTVQGEGVPKMWCVHFSAMPGRKGFSTLKLEYAQNIMTFFFDTTAELARFSANVQRAVVNITDSLE